MNQVNYQNLLLGKFGDELVCTIEKGIIDCIQLNRIYDRIIFACRF
jgi:hypothetical protein